MILIAASLTVIAVLHISIGDNVLYGDSILRLKTMEFNNCVENNFEGEDCKRYTNSIVAQECIEDRDLSSPKCFKYQTWIQSDIFEECRANRDMVSTQCQEYTSLYEAEPEV